MQEIGALGLRLGIMSNNFTMYSTFYGQDHNTELPGQSQLTKQIILKPLCDARQWIKKVELLNYCELFWILVNVLKNRKYH